MSSWNGEYRIYPMNHEWIEKNKIKNRHKPQKFMSFLNIIFLCLFVSFDMQISIQFNHHLLDSVLQFSWNPPVLQIPKLAKWTILYYYKQYCGSLRNFLRIPTSTNQTNPFIYRPILPSTRISIENLLPSPS